MFKFFISLDDEDYLEFNQYHFLHSGTGKRALGTYRLIIPILCLVLALLVFVITSDLAFFAIVSALLTVYSVIWILFSRKLILRAQRKSLGKLKQDGKLPYQKESTLIFEADVILEITEETENRTRYSMVEKVAGTETALYIYTSSLQAFILPLAAFSGEEEKQRFLRFLKAKGIVLQRAPYRGTVMQRPGFTGHRGKL